MNKRARRKELIQLEKNLLNRVSPQDDNLLILTNDSFDERGDLTPSGYNSLKEQGQFIGFGNVKISVPENGTDNFVKSLNAFATKEIITIRKEERLLKRISLLLMVIGIITLWVCYLVSFSALMYEIFLVASWVFIWVAVEKFFFELTGLRRQKTQLLQIIDAAGR